MRRSARTCIQQRNRGSTAAWRTCLIPWTGHWYTKINSIWPRRLMTILKILWVNVSQERCNNRIMSMLIRIIIWISMMVGLPVQMIIKPMPPNLKTKTKLQRRQVSCGRPVKISIRIFQAVTYMTMIIMMIIARINLKNRSIIMVLRALSAKIHLLF